MYKLTMFQKFDFNSFQKDKSFAITNVKYNEKKGCVTLDVVITEDYTDYGDTTLSNLYEKFKTHLVTMKSETDIEKYNVGDKIRFKSTGKISVYGDYASQLSVEAVVEVINDED